MYCDITWSVNQGFQKSSLSPATCSEASNNFCTFQCLPQLPTISHAFQHLLQSSNNFPHLPTISMCSNISRTHSATTGYLSIVQSNFRMTSTCSPMFLSSFCLFFTCSHSPSFQTCSRWNIHLVYSHSNCVPSVSPVWISTLVPFVSFSVWSVFQNRTLCVWGRDARVEATPYLLCWKT